LVCHPVADLFIAATVAASVVSWNRDGGVFMMVSVKITVFGMQFLGDNMEAVFS
jgi:hypothetical protein